MKSITIVGAGPVGLLAAVYLAKRGYVINIFERRPDMRSAQIVAGRSINLALSERGWKGLAGAGLEESIRSIAIAMPGRMIHDLAGKETFQSYGSDGQAIYSVSRRAINVGLLELADSFENISLHFNKRCASLDPDNNSVTFLDEITHEESSVQSDLIIGADGAYSAVRNRLMMTDRFDYSQDYLRHGYKELSIPAGEIGSYLLEKNALHIWPRGEFMLIALPNLDGSFTCTIFLEWEGPNSFEQLNSSSKVNQFFEEKFPDAKKLMPTLENDFATNPSSSLMIVRCSPWYYKDTFLIGDSAHAIVPFYGQGMNAGFEDCRLLNSILDSTKDDWSRALPAYQARRKPNGDAIAELAVANFNEMRDKVADREFLFRKTIEHLSEERHPDKFKSQYQMVTFSHIPYSVAHSTARAQAGIVDELIVRGVTQGTINDGTALPILDNLFNSLPPLELHEE